MASITEGQAPPPAASMPAGRIVAGVALLAAGLGAAIFAALLVANAPPPSILGGGPDYFIVGTFALSALLMLVGGGICFTRPGLGGGLGLTGAIVFVAALLFAKTFGGLLAVPLFLGFAGSLTGLVSNDRVVHRTDPRLIYRQSIFTRITHWVWAVAMFFLVLTGLQIWNAHPALYIGQQSGFAFDNAILEIGAENTDAGPRGFTTVFGQKFDTTGVLGVSGTATRPQYVGFPAWATIPSFRDLATGRVIHFFFAWLLVGALAVWLIASLANRHLWRDIILKPRDIRDLPRDIVDHIRLKFHHTRTYSPLQKLAYFAVFIVLFPLIILTGLTMSPGMDAAWPWLLDVFGGRQTARTLHFLAMMGLTIFFVVHVIMVVLAGPLNELRSMITGYYKTSADAPLGEEKAK
jgi:thiosulfate reductase cytochrome b subunit